MKKIVSMAATVAIAATIVGCTAPEPEQQQQQEQNVQEQPSNAEQSPDPAPKPEPQSASVGEKIEASTQYGDLIVSVDGFTFDEKSTAQLAEFGQIQEGKSVGLLQLTVENVSFNYNDGYIPLDEIVYAEDESGIALSVMSTSHNNGQEYQTVAGGYYKHPQGKTMRVAIPYVTDPTATAITAVVGNIEVPVSIV